MSGCVRRAARAPHAFGVAVALLVLSTAVGSGSAFATETPVIPFPDALVLGPPPWAGEREPDAARRVIVRVDAPAGHVQGVDATLTTHHQEGVLYEYRNPGGVSVGVLETSTAYYECGGGSVNWSPKPGVHPVPIHADVWRGCVIGQDDDGRVTTFVWRYRGVNASILGPPGTQLDRMHLTALI